MKQAREGPFANRAEPSRTDMRLRRIRLRQVRTGLSRVCPKFYHACSPLASASVLRSPPIAACDSSDIVPRPRCRDEAPQFAASLPRRSASRELRLPDIRRRAQTLRDVPRQNDPELSPLRIYERSRGESRHSAPASTSPARVHESAARYPSRFGRSDAAKRENDSELDAVSLHGEPPPQKVPPPHRLLPESRAFLPDPRSECPIAKKRKQGRRKPSGYSSWTPAARTASVVLQIRLYNVASNRGRFVKSNRFRD